MHSLQQKLIPELEARLRKKCECVVSFHDSSAAGTGIKILPCSSDKKDALFKFSWTEMSMFPFSESSSLMFAKASQLPALLDSEKQKSEEERKQLIKDKSARERQFRQYYQVCYSYSTSSMVGDNMFNCVIFNDLISNISSYYFNNRP